MFILLAVSHLNGTFHNILTFLELAVFFFFFPVQVSTSWFVTLDKFIIEISVKYLDVTLRLELRSVSLEKMVYFILIRGFPGSLVGKESAYNAEDPSSIPESLRSAGEGIGYPPQYSWASLVTQLVKNPPAMRETCV